jgi:peroxiredoxin
VIATGEPLPDVSAWRAPNEPVRLRDLSGPAGALFLFYLFDWSST